MSLLAIVYHLVPEAPILVAYNREESSDFVFSTPSIQPGKPRILASIDKKTGGTYLGMNQNGLLVGLVRRRKFQVPPNPKSRGLLVKDLLGLTSARQAVDYAMEELETQPYAGGNFVIADPESGWVVKAGNETEVTDLPHGLSIVGNRDLNDGRDERGLMARRLLTLQTLDSPVKFLAIASRVLARAPSAPGRPSMVVKGERENTVNSTLISLGSKPRDAIYQFSNGSPDEAKFEDYSPMLRDILSRGLRESRAKANV